jgi:hypothetical protein
MGHHCGSQLGTGDQGKASALGFIPRGWRLGLGAPPVTTPNLSQIRSARYAFHHNPRIIVVIHIT